VSSGVTIEPHKKQLHVSLAYQFPTEKKEKLETLAKALNMKAPVRWDLRLYSRDVLKGKSNYQVWFSHWTKFEYLIFKYALCGHKFCLISYSNSHFMLLLKASFGALTLLEGHPVCVFISGHRRRNYRNGL